MRLNRLTALLVASTFVLAVLAAGCGGDSPQTPPELAKAVAGARDEARTACEAKDPKAARQAAGRAIDRLARLRKLSEDTDAAAAEAKTLLVAADADARAAREWADLAEEELRMTKLRGSLKAKAYRAGRAVLLAGVFKGLALAADQAAAKGLAGLPPKIQELANTAAGLSAELAGRKPLADGSPDWAGISADMSTCAAEPPEELALYLSAAWALSGRGAPALWEMDLVDAAVVAPAADERQVRTFLPVIVYRVNGCPRLAMRSLQTALGVEELTPDERAMLHTTSALLYAMEKDWGNVDLELGRALKASPNNPVAVYLTGERLAADGQWEKSADSLEAAGRALGEDQWLARRMAERARQVRDRSGADQPLFLDRAFLVRLSAEAAGRAAARSEAAAKLKRWLENAGVLGRMLEDHEEAEAEAGGEMPADEAPSVPAPPQPADAAAQAEQPGNREH
jgi:hypothetical protein